MFDAKANDAEFLKLLVSTNFAAFLLFTVLFKIMLFGTSCG